MGYMVMMTIIVEINNFIGHVIGKHGQYFTTGYLQEL